jgi:hypothetical protein
MSQTLSIQEHYLVVFVRPEIYSAKKKKFKQSHDLSDSLGKPEANSGRPQNLIHHRHVGLHVDFPSMKYSSLGF